MCTKYEQVNKNWNKKCIKNAQKMHKKIQRFDMGKKSAHKKYKNCTDNVQKKLSINGVQKVYKRW